ncbi:MAG: hypothetical protein WC233_05855 [Sphaerochaeta sp.]|jgi:hypothetical protein|nr:hypothetical protein [Spirochaetales bacterium]
MNWSLKKVGLILLIACMAFGLWAEESVFIADGDIGSLKLYDRDGGLLDATLSVTDYIGEGWILHNPESDLLIVTPLGAINLYQDSLLITSSLRPGAIELYLVTGEATFNSWGAGGTLTVRTPATQYTMRDEAEMLVITNDTEESVTAFSGSIESLNLITGAVTDISVNEKLHLRDMSRTATGVQSGYYYTYGTFITEEAFQYTAEEIRASLPAAVEELVIEEALAVDEALLLIPAKPSTLLVGRYAPQAIQLPPAPTVKVEEVVEGSVVPTAPTVDISSVSPTALAATPAAPVLTVAAVEKTAALPTVPTLDVSAIESVETEPVTPSVPSLYVKAIEKDAVVIDTTAMESTIASELVIPLAPTVRVAGAKQLVPSAPLPVVLEQEDEMVVAEEEPVALEEEVVDSGVAAARPALSSSEEQSRREGSIGVIAGYDFVWDGTDSDTLSHRLFVKPYFSKGPFAITLNAAISTEDFSSYANTVLPIPEEPLALASYILSYFEHLRIGYETSAFYLLLDNQRSIRSDLSTFFAPHFLAGDKLILQNKISIGPVSLISSFDDLLFTGLQDGKSQWASTIVEYTAGGGYPFTLAVGTLAEIEIDPEVINLYPLISAKLPIINSRKTRLDGLIQAQGYLPVYPNVDWDQFVDTSLTYFFPNYLLGGGLALNKGDFNAKVMATLNRGKNRNYLINDFAYQAMHGYDSTFDVLAELGWDGKWLQSSLAWNLPFTSGFKRARLSADPTQGADYSHFSLETTIGQFSLGFGLQQLGVIDTLTDLFAGDAKILDLFAGPYASSFLKASYTIAPFTFSTMALYPIKNASFTTPRLSVTAKVDLNKRF